MASGGASENVLAQTVDGFAQRVNDYAQGIASRLGQPLSGVQLSPDDAVARWNYSPLGDTAAADAQYHQLTVQGVPPGQALAQVYPMRPMLFQGQDINESIAKAQQVAGWAAKSAGQPPPEKPPAVSTLPMAIMQQNLAQASSGAAPPPALPPPPAMPGGQPPPPPGMAGVPLSAPPAMPGLPAAPPQLPIPAMASGGVVTQPTVALIGEQGPEAVVPLTPPPQPNIPLGVNIDPLNPTARPGLNDFGMDKIGGVRAVSRNNAQQNAYLDSLKAGGKQVMSVVTPESQGFVYPKSDSLQIGNEMDSSGPSSSPMSPQDYANMWNTYRNQYQGKVGQFVMGGLGSGLGNAKAYLNQVWPLLQTKPDQVALHLYDGDVNQSLAEIQDVQQELKNLGSKAQVVVTEWNKPPGQEWDMQNMFNQAGVPYASHYPYSTGQNPSTPGLVSAQGQPTAVGAGLVSAVP